MFRNVFRMADEVQAGVRSYCKLLGDDHRGTAVHGDETRGNEGDVVEVGVGDRDGDLVAGAVAVGGDEAGGEARGVCVGGADGDVRAVDAGKDLIVEVGFEGP